MRRKSMPVLSVPGALVGGDEVTMAVFHELSRAEGPSQQSRKTTAGSGLRTRGQTDLTANFRQNAPEIHASLVSPRGRSWVAMKSPWQFFMSFRGPKAHPNRVEKAPSGRTHSCVRHICQSLFRKFRGRKAHPNRQVSPRTGAPVTG